MHVPLQVMRHYALIGAGRLRTAGGRHRDAANRLKTWRQAPGTNAILSSAPPVGGRLSVDVSVQVPGCKDKCCFAIRGAWWWVRRGAVNRGLALNFHQHQQPLAARRPVRRQKPSLSYAESSLHEIFGHEAEGVRDLAVGVRRRETTRDERMREQCQMELEANRKRTLDRSSNGLGNISPL